MMQIGNGTSLIHYQQQQSGAMTNVQSSSISQASGPQDAASQAQGLVIHPPILLQSRPMRKFSDNFLRNLIRIHLQFESSTV